MSRRFCTECGESIAEDARFCGSCGHPIESEGSHEPVRPEPEVRPAHAGAHASQSSRQSVLEAQNAGIEAYTPRRLEKRTLLFLIAGGSAIALLVAGYFVVSAISSGKSSGPGVYDSSPVATSSEGSDAEGQPQAAISEESQPNRFEDYEDEFLANADESLFATGAANMRNYPTTEGTQIVDRFSTNDRLTGRWVRGFDPETRWLRIDGVAGTGYIWEGNLSTEQQPTERWLAGLWSYAPSCETDGIDFDRRGRISTLPFSGTYELDGDIVRYDITFDNDAGVVVDPPTQRTFRIKRIDQDHAEIVGRGGQSIDLYRC